MSNNDDPKNNNKGLSDQMMAQFFGPPRDGLEENRLDIKERYDKINPDDKVSQHVKDIVAVRHDVISVMQLCLTLDRNVNAISAKLDYLTELLLPKDNQKVH